MPRACSVCIHEKRAEIDAALLKGNSYRSISQQYAVSLDALARHKKNGHVSRELEKYQDAKGIERTGTIWDDLNHWKKEINELYQVAKSSQQITPALNAIDKALKALAVFAQMKERFGDEHREVDPIALAHEVMMYLKGHFPKAHKGLLKYLEEQCDRGA